MNTQVNIKAIVLPEQAKKRLDQAVAELFPQYSRTRLKNWILSHQITVNGTHWDPKTKVLGGEIIEINAVIESEQSWEPQAIELDILFEDEALIVINKPAGLVVHPAAGNWEGTLVNALLHRIPSLASLPRAGIVHRIDKETSGLLVVAKTLTSHTALTRQIQLRTMKREYTAIVTGRLIAGDTIDMPIGRHPVHRKRMGISKTGRPAITHYRILERFLHHTLIKVQLETGRTHQIRVHMAAIHHPIVGDPVYGGRFKIPPNASEELINTLRNFKRQALHAFQLSFEHPISQKEVQFIAPLPEDMRHLIALLKKDMQHESS